MVGEPKKEPPAKHIDVLTERLESLENQLSRLTNFLTEQDAARKSRRRRFTIRFLMITMVLFAGLFAWFSTAYHQSRKQADAVDRLFSLGAFVMYEPRQSVAVSVLPGSPEEPPRVISKSLGVDFFRAATNVSTQSGASSKMDKDAILDAVSSLRELKRLRLTKLTFSTGDLAQLSDLSELTSLDLTRTRLDNGSLPWLQDTQLQWFDGSHTWLGNTALHDLSRCPDLQNLSMERTTVTDAGLLHLYQMKNLRYLNLKRCDVTPAAIKKLSAAIPNCIIDYEPLVLTSGGETNAVAARRGFMRLGNSRAIDPRESKQAIPPSDGYRVTFQQGGYGYAYPPPATAPPGYSIPYPSN